VGQIQAFKNAISNMAARPEYHHPIVAAQRQFRERYYGLSSAAMLEDLFVDAFASYLRSHEPSLRFARPPRGEKGYDYEFEGERWSHKVSKDGPIAIAALWDATRQDSTWTFETPISLSTGGYSAQNLTLQSGEGGPPLVASPIRPDIKVKKGSVGGLVHWHPIDGLRFLKTWPLPVGDSIEQSLPFEDLWSEVVRAIGEGCNSNEIELLVLRGSSSINDNEKYHQTSHVFRPGMYLFDQSKLIDIKVAHNNRAVLVPKAFVAQLMSSATLDNNFVPMTNWFACYAGGHPPDLYLAQRAEFDKMFSNSGR
jgi:hypothetical protein